ncbi:MAG: 50S ribosomal protein L1 [Pseudomonadales bacterium]|nr:50S ribosomal protein L1 [Pseudomonadales bacterium]
MAKLGKRKRSVNERVDRTKVYPIEEAVALLNDLAKTGFAESIDVAVNLAVDPRKSEQAVRGATTLPHGSGKEVRVAVFAQGDNADTARAAGADVVGLDDLAERVNGGELDFDVVIATPDAMRVVGALGRVLGPRGLMPNPKTGTVTADVETAVKNAKSGQVQFRADRGGIVHGRVGTVGFEPLHVKENLEALIQDLRRARPASSKGHYLKRITLSTTMGPGLRIDEGSLGV